MIIAGLLIFSYYACNKCPLPYPATFKVMALSDPVCRAGSLQVQVCTTEKAGADLQVPSAEAFTRHLEYKNSFASNLFLFIFILPILILIYFTTIF